MRKSTYTRAFTEAFWYFAHTIQIQWAVHEEVSCQKNYFWESDCLSNVAILYGLYSLDSSFLYWPLLGGGYLTSITCPFFHSNSPGHVNKMAAMPTYGKNPLKIFSETSRLMALELGPYKICSNDDPGLTLTYFTTRSTLLLMLLYGKILKY